MVLYADASNFVQIYNYMIITALPLGKGLGFDSNADTNWIIQRDFATNKIPGFYYSKIKWIHGYNICK